MKKSGKEVKKGGKEKKNCKWFAWLESLTSHYHFLSCIKYG